MIGEIRIDSLKFTTGTLEDICGLVASYVTAKRGLTVLPCSLHDLAQSEKRGGATGAYQNIDMLLPDGVPIVWMIRARGGETDRIYGPDLMRKLLSLPSVRRVRHAFYGSSPQTLAKLRKIMLRLNNNRTICISPPYRSLTAQEEQHYTSRLKRFRPACLWIGISSPKQVVFAVKWKRLFPHTVIFCVGAAFDIITGTVPQAPHAVQAVGLEWAFRLLTDPRRLWKRYLVDIPHYLLRRLLHLTTPLSPK